MGVWFLAIVAANLLAGKLSTLYPEAGQTTYLFGFDINNLADLFMIFVIMTAAASLILFLIYNLLLKMMHGVT